MKIKIIILLLICSHLASIYIGYQFNRSKLDEIQVTKSEIKTGIIKEINLDDKAQVKIAFKSKIDIKRDYVFSNNNTILVSIRASDEFKFSETTDIIKIKNQSTDYTNAVIVGSIVVTAAVLTTLYLTRNKSIQIPLTQMRF